MTEQELFAQLAKAQAIEARLESTVQHLEEELAEDNGPSAEDPSDGRSLVSQREVAKAAQQLPALPVSSPPLTTAPPRTLPPVAVAPAAPSGGSWQALANGTAVTEQARRAAVERAKAQINVTLVDFLAAQKTKLDRARRARDTAQATLAAKKAELETAKASLQAHVQAAAREVQSVKDPCAGRWRAGDAVSSRNNSVGTAQNFAGCYQLVSTTDKCIGANAATMPSSGPGACYCEIGATGRDNAEGLASCLFEIPPVDLLKIQINNARTQYEQAYVAADKAVLEYTKLGSKQVAEYTARVDELLTTVADNAVAALEGAATTTTTKQIEVAGYDHWPQSCVTNPSGHATVSGQTLASCALLCDADATCVAFEYGVAYGGNASGAASPGDCIQEDNAEASACDGQANNKDLYVKICGIGYYQSSGTCTQCVGGNTRRRRCSECTDCPDGYYDPGNEDNCTECLGGYVTRRRSTGCLDCAPGKYKKFKSRADNCTECDGGSTTRRRSSTCTPCMIGKYDTGGVDDCSVVGHIPLKNKGFDKCLDFNAEHGHNVYMHDCDGSARQMWHFEGEHLKSVESKEMCLAYEKSPAASQMHNVFMRMCADTLDMSWYFAGEALKNKAVGWQRDLCLDYDDAGTHIYMNGCIPTAATERWYFSAQACHAGHFQSGRSCMNCVGGSTSRRRSVECAECAPGSYDAGFTDDCTACPGGTMRRRRAVSCEACPRGYYNPGGRDNCMQCVGGHIRRRRANDCELCPNNTYQHPGNWDKCYRCVGQVSRRRRGATHCDMTTTTTTTTVTTVTSTSTITTVSFCSAGLYLLPDGTCAHCTGETRRRRATTCTECAKGMFDPGDDRDDCLDCKGGQVQRRRATSCTACAAGYYDKGGYDDCHVCSGGSVRRRRALICNHCTLGMYWEGHKDECTACNGGFVRRRNQGGALECTVCPPGKYDPGKDDDCMECNGGSTGRRRAEACTDCPNGYYDAGNADDCRQCEGGSTSRRRATTCTECELGFYDAGDLDDCEKCAGGFVDRRRATQCSNCSDGYYDPPTNNLDECINCAAGDVRRRRADACTACPAGKYDPTDNIGDSCMTCNGGQTARRRSTTCEECDVGWYDHAGHDDCQQCLGGSVRRRLALTCEECGPGYYFTGDSDDCKQCQGGSTRRRAREIGACTMCLNGTYDEGNLDDCQVCEGGETRRRREAYSCLPTTSTTTTTTTITTTTITFSLEQMPVELHTCGATGRNGPTNDQCKHYPAYSINKVQVFEGYQYYKIPTAGGYTITAKGARGGNHGQGLGGYGAKVTGTYNFNKNDELLMVIGQVGYDNPNYTAQWGGGGGGGTFVSMIHSSGDIVVSNIMPEDKTLALLIAAGGGAGRYDEANSGQSAGGRHSKGDPTTQATGIRKGPGGGGGYRLDGLGGGPHVVNEKQASAKAFMHGATGGYTTNGTEYFGGFGGGGAPFHGGGGGGGYDGGDCCQGRRRHCDHNCLGGSSYEALQRVHGGFGGIGCGGATANYNDEEGSVHIQKVVALFTTCGKRGRHGPNQMDCSVNDGRLYAGDSPQITLSQGYRFFTVPWDGSYTIRAFGSRGGDHGSGLGGYGAEAKMEQTFVQGDQMVVLVGQHGWDNPVDADGGGGGGGGTFVAKTLVYSNAGDQLGWPGDQIDTGLDDMKVHIQLLLAAGGGSGMRDTNTTGQAAGGRGESCDVDSAATGDDTGGGGGGGYKLNGKGGGNNKGIAFLKGAVGGGNNFSANGTEIRYGGFGGGGRSMDGGGGGGGYDGGDCCLKSNGLGGRTCNFECTGGCSMGTKLIGNCNHGDGAVILSKVPYSVITFTTCEKSGRYGPTQADCAATPGISVQNGFQKFMINKTGSYRIMAAGARGGNHGGGKGGYGARVQYVYHLQRGDVLVAAVGQTGWDNPSDSDWGGGGGGGTYLGRISNGASDPVISVLNTKVKLMLLAGGGAGMKAIEPGEHYPNNGRAQGGIASGGDAATAAAGGSSGSGAGYMMDGAGGGQASKSFANGAVGGQHTNPNLRRRTQRDHLHFGGFGGGGGPYNGAGGGGGYHGGECCLGGGSRRRACDASCGGGTSFGGMGHPSINKGEGYVEVTQVPPGVVEFTTCEKIGRLGPESSDCNQIGVTVDKGYQFYTIPVTGKYHLQAYGSRGGDHGLARGGKGALAMRSNLAFYEGERLVVLVGQRGWDNPSDRDWGGGGGGASFVAKWKAGADYNITVLTDSVKYPNGVTVELILAAGGGAGVMDTLNQLTTQGEGGLATAGNADEAAAGDKNGGGGGFKLDGLGGIWKPEPTSLPGSTAKSFLNGAMGGGSTNQWGGFGGGGRPYDGAGGGGGYSGGACTMGGDNKACRGGGSWAGTGSDGSVMENYNDGDGLVVLTRTEPSLAVAFAAPSR